ncbi:MAG: ATP-binding protein [Holosporales bacterium]|jgi:hypothetical protein
MDKATNPFAPGAGTTPPELAGRQDILEHIRIALARIRNGLAEKSMILIGLRGVGKTVLLNEMEKMAQNSGYQTALIEATENRIRKRLSDILVPHLRRILLHLDRDSRLSTKVKSALRALQSFASQLKINLGGVEIAIAEPEPGIADSGDLETDLADLFVAVGEAAADRKTGVAILIDELQYLEETDLSALIMATHKIAQKGLPVLVIGAGLPQILGKMGNAKSYAERLFTYPMVGELTTPDAENALQVPVKRQNISFTPDALKEIIRVTKAYPYFLQEWGYHAWNAAAASPITVTDIHHATQQALQRLDTDFFRVRFDRLTPSEKRYVRALAELGGDPQRSGDVAEKLGVSVNRVAPLRSALIKKGMIYSPAHGDTAFTVPMFEDFLKRVMPEEA